MTRISLIVAMTPDGVIGKDNALPWRLSADLRRFKALTLGKPVVMGRKTFQSLPGGPLPGRPNIVVSRDKDFRPDGAEVFDSLPDALARAKQLTTDEVMVIGGAQVYAQALPMADRLYITEVHAPITGDTHFPLVRWAEWREISREDHPAEGEIPGYSFVAWERRN